jgi:hypothetical protein
VIGLDFAHIFTILLIMLYRDMNPDFSDQGHACIVRPIVSASHEPGYMGLREPLRAKNHDRKYPTCDGDASR